MAVVHKGRALWRSGATTLTYGYGDITQAETTALAAYAFIKSHTHPDLATQALNELIARRDSFGSFSTTQVTILALKAFLAGSTEGVGGSGDISVVVNGRPAGDVHFTGDDSDIVRVIDASDLAHPGANSVEISVNGSARPVYQLTAEYYLPWELVPRPRAGEMSISVDYGKLRVEREGLVDVTARVRANKSVVRMAMVDLGIAPGFGVVTEDLESLKSRGLVYRYEITPRQIILYLRDLRAGKPLQLSYRLRALYPVRAQVPASRTYDYYNPNSRRSLAKPVTIEIE